MNLKKLLAAILFCHFIIACGHKAAGPKTYEDLGQQVIDHLRTGDYASLKELWPTESKFKSFARDCSKDGKKPDEESINKKADGLNEYRNSIKEMIEKQAEDILPGLKDAKYLSTSFEDKNECPGLFRSVGKMKILFTVKHDSLQASCYYVAQTKSGDFYFLDKLRIEDASSDY